MPHIFIRSARRRVYLRGQPAAGLTWPLSRSASLDAAADEVPELEMEAGPDGQAEADYD